MSNFVYLSKQMKKEAINLTTKRLEAFTRSKNSRSPKNKKRCNTIGSYGEIGMSNLLDKFNLPHEDLYKFFKRIDKGDVLVGDLYLEIKTRTKFDWKIYSNQTPLKQVESYRKRNLNAVYVWVSYSRITNKIICEGWNKLEDFKINFIDKKKMSSRCDMLRDFKSLICLCSKRQRKSSINTKPKTNVMSSYLSRPRTISSSVQSGGKRYSYFRTGSGKIKIPKKYAKKKKSRKISKKTKCYCRVSCYG